MSSSITKVIIFMLFWSFFGCGDGGRVPPGLDGGWDSGKNFPDLKSDFKQDDVGEIGLDLSIDSGRDAGIDTADSEPDLPPARPTNAPTFPRTFLDLYGDIVNDQNTDPSNFTPERLTIVEGRVLDDKAAPLVDVKISAPDFPNLGHVNTDADGNYSFAINGGGVLNLRYAKTGFIESERRVQSRWQEFVHIGPIVLKEYSKTVTPISFSSANQIQIARGDIESDSAGERQATLLVNPNTNASLRLKDGSLVDMPTLNLRFTEFTVGAAGPLAMPGDLPGTSAYTYAVEISADEAVSMDATSVEFDKPVYFYVDDFLGFPAGTVVPIGYYDREKHAWIPSDNGKVIAIVSIENGKAAIDIDGDGFADSGTLLSDIGISDEERIQLASLYLPGKVLWRGPMTHLTPWDHNFPYGLADDAQIPKAFKNPKDPNDDPCEHAGSIIECESKVLREFFALSGTPFYLVYNSFDHKFLPSYDVLIPMEPPSIPSGGSSSLQCVYATIKVGGKLFKHGLSKEEIEDVNIDKFFNFRWDGKNRDDLILSGQHRYEAELVYVYNLIYYASPSDQARSFSNVGGASSNYIQSSPRTNPNKKLTEFTGTACGVNPRASDGSGTITATIGLSAGKSTGEIGQLRKGKDLAGWTLSPHHQFDWKSDTMHLGGGKRYSAKTANFSLLAGDGTKQNTGWADGQTSISRSLGREVYHLEIKSDGTLITDYGGQSLILPSLHYVEHRPDGKAYLSPELIHEGNAISYSILKVGPDDAVYLADGRRIFREKDGLVEAIVNPPIVSPVDENYAGPLSDNGIGFIRDLVITSDGTVFVLASPNSNSPNLLVWRITQDGFLSRVYGSFSSLEFRNGYNIPNASTHLSKLLLDSRDRLYLKTRNEVIRIGNDGEVEKLLGGGDLSLFFDGVAGTDIKITFSKAHIDRNDNIVFTAISDGRVFVLGDDKNIKHVAGRKSAYTQDDFYKLPLDQVNVFYSDAVFSHTNELIVLAPGVGYIAKIKALGSNRNYVLSDDGALTYVIDRNGKHLETRDVLTGNLVYEFSYDAYDRLIAVKDNDGLQTTIERDDDGNPTSIVGPYGLRSQLELHPSGMLKSITNAAGERTSFTYTNQNLIQSMTDPKGNTKTYRFDGDGRLTGETDALGSRKELEHERTANSLRGTVVSEMGRRKTHKMDTLGNENSLVRTTEDSAGFVIKTTVVAGKDRTIEYPDGRVVSVGMATANYLRGSHPYVDQIETLYPSGKRISLSFEQESEDSGDPLLGMESFTTRSTLNNQTTTTTYDGVSKTSTTTSPEGRISYSKLDEKGRVIESAKAGLLPTFMEYDNDGRLTKMTQGTRTSSFSYDQESNVERVTDSMNRSVDYGFDAVGRTISQSLPDGRTHNFAFDSNGNLSTIQPSGRGAHSFDHNEIDQTTKYSPPILQSVANPSTGQQYNLDHQPTKTTLSDGREIDIEYDTAGRLNTINAPLGTYTTNYSSTTGQVESISGLDNGLVSFEYDGDLVTKVTNIQGEVSGEVQWTYDNALRARQIRINGRNVAYLFDNDGAITRAGLLNYTRDPTTGFVSATTLRNLGSQRVINAYGELESEVFSYNGVDLFDTQHTYNDMGQISDRIETIEGISKTYSYTYDENDRLTEVFEDGNLVEEFTFDANDNVSERKVNGSTTIATFDDQDRLVSRGTKLYRYNDHGQLNEIADNVSGDLTNLDYDVFGSLRQVSMPDGTLVDYIIDASGRRVGKRINGTFDKGWVYAAGPRPVAELDNVGNVNMLFVYGTNSVSPEYLVRGNTTYRIVKDHLGSVRMVVNASTGVVQQEIRYDVYGKKVLDTNPGFQPFGFAGGLHDADTGFVQFSARDYDPESGRWMAKDPSGFNGQSANLYAYVNGDPINYIDPSGRVPVDTFFDIASIFYDLYRIAADNVFGDCDNLGDNLTALGLDVLGLVIPYAAGLGMAYRAGKAAKKLKKLSCSFTEESTVSTCSADGVDEGNKRAINTIEEGDWVLSKNEQTGDVSCQRVRSPYVNPNRVIYELTTRNETGETSVLETTDNHPFYMDGRGWTRVDELRNGDLLEAKDAILEVVEIIKTDRVEDVYNFGVNGNYSYFVGENEAWVHNCLVERAAALIPLNDNKHRVKIRSIGEFFELDLAGAAHAGIPTPHIKISPRNLKAPKHLGPKYNTTQTPVRPATQQDIRTARRYLERRGR